MAYIDRALTNKITELSKQMPAILITGPRQVGKTTILRTIAETERQYVSFDDIPIRELAQNDPKLFLKQYRPPLIIDEIQYVPELLPYLKIEIDNSTASGLYWLTGSQQFQLMQGISESLAGRIAVLSMLGFSQRELLGKKNTDPFLPEESLLQAANQEESPLETFTKIMKGSMPKTNTMEIDLEVFFGSYLQTYLLRDLREISQIADIKKFTRFVRACAARTGQLLNYSNLARDTDVSVQTAKNWISILETSFLVYLLQPYHENITKRITKTPKLYFTDTGLAAYLTSWKTPETLMNGAMSGAIFETYVITELLKSYWNAGKEAPLYFYRDKDGKEIDVLIEQDGKIHPIEVKISGTVNKNWLKNFSVLQKLKKKIGMGAVVCLTDNAQYINADTIAIHVNQI